MNKIRPIILCGGSGTRLWPLSTPTTPKHLLEIDGMTLLERTVKRIESLFDLEPLLVIGSGHTIPPSLSHLEAVKEDHQNETAVAVYRALKRIKTEYVISFHADHFITDDETFRSDILEGIKLIGMNNIVLYGIQPTSPDPRYGYILDGCFFEKPSESLAKTIISKGGVWNSGIFAGSVAFILRKLEEREEVMSYYEFPRPGKAGSFDVEVLQLLSFENLSVFPCQEWGWEDVGVWSSFIRKSDPYINRDSNNILVYDKEEGEIAVVGCNNLIVVRTGGKVLIMSQEADSNLLKSM